MFTGPKSEFRICMSSSDNFPNFVATNQPFFSTKMNDVIYINSTQELINKLSFLTCSYRKFVKPSNEFDISFFVFTNKNLTDQIDNNN